MANRTRRAPRRLHGTPGARSGRPGALPWPLGLALALACGDADGPTTDASGTETGAADDTTSGGSDTGGETQVTPFRFIAMGDGGEGNAAQFQVANAVEMVCADTGGCDLVLYLGDNFYDTGVTAVDDMQFMTKFEEPYADLDMPFWVVMGNHDYGSISNEWDKAMFQVEYTQFSDKWTMPDVWYAQSNKGVDFFALDTTQLMWDRNTAMQRSWLDGELAASTGAWRIAFAHHPYVSNGSHGNAGNYEGLPAIDLVNGKVVKEFIDGSICGNVDLYISGHDHDRQWLEPVCGTQFLVSGAAAKTRGFEHRDGNETAWEDDQREGFLWVEVQDDHTMVTRFYDLDGTMDFERVITK